MYYELTYLYTHVTPVATVTSIRGQRALQPIRTATAGIGLG